MPHVRANGLDIGYEVAGAGPPLVALHGATGAGRHDFARLVPSLASAFRVHLPDARGHATTRWDVAAGGFATEDLVDDVEAFADALGLETFHLLGFSMGGMTALWFAVRRPERLRTLVAIGISPLREPRATVVRHQLDPDRITAQEPSWGAMLRARHDPVQGPGAWRRLLPAIAADVASQPLLTPAQLRGVAPPTLVACGDRDPFVPVDQAAGLARQVRDGRLLVVPDSGHPVIDAQPELIDVALRGFYRSTEPVARRRATAPPEVTR